MPKPTINWNNLIHISKNKFQELFVISKVLWINLIQKQPLDIQLIGDLCISIQAVFEANQNILDKNLNDIMAEANKMLKSIEEEKNKGIKGLKKKILDILTEAFGDKQELIEEQDLYCINEEILKIFKLVEE